MKFEGVYPAIITPLDETNKFKVGDMVKIIESKPFSKMKKWEVISK